MIERLALCNEVLAPWGFAEQCAYAAKLGYRALENPVNVHDLHATMLALMGVDHRRLNSKYQGLDVRLTGIAGEVVKGLMA
jgi:hypothetical protein